MFDGMNGGALGAVVLGIVMLFFLFQARRLEKIKIELEKTVADQQTQIADLKRQLEEGKGKHRSRNRKIAKELEG
jgi:cell division protein FtsL